MAMLAKSGSPRGSSQMPPGGGGSSRASGSGGGALGGRDPRCHREAHLAGQLRLGGRGSARARHAAARILQGQSAYLNFPQDPPVELPRGMTTTLMAHRSNLQLRQSGSWSQPESPRSPRESPYGRGPSSLPLPSPRSTHSAPSSSLSLSSELEGRANRRNRSQRKNSNRTTS